MPRRIKESAFFRSSNTVGKEDLLRQRKPYHKDDMREAKKLYRLLLSMIPYGNRRHERTYKPVFLPKSKEQLCIIKLRKGFDKAKHLRFLEEYLPQNNKDEVIEKPKLFSNGEVDNVFVEGYKENMTDLHYKFIISPENPNVDCKALVKTLIKRMEQVTGYKFIWVGAVHTNTNHPHAHLLINGKDENGKTVEMNNIFLTRTIREMARQICTQMIGQRTNHEIEASMQKIPFANRYTFIDSEIENKMKVLPDEDSKYGFSVVPSDNLMYQRLCHLESIGFAKKEKEQSKKFYLEKGWNEKLKSAGRYSSFLKARQELLFTSSGDLELFTKESKLAAGTITKLYKMNYEESWDNALVLENRDSKRAWFIPLFNEPNEKLLNANAIVFFEEGKGNRSKIHIKVTEWGIDRNIGK